MFIQDLENERLKREDMKKEIERNRADRGQQPAEGGVPKKKWPALFSKKQPSSANRQPFKN